MGGGGGGGCVGGGGTVRDTVHAMMLPPSIELFTVENIYCQLSDRNTTFVLLA